MHSLFLLCRWHPPRSASNAELHISKRSLEAVMRYPILFRSVFAVIFVSSVLGVFGQSAGGFSFQINGQVRYADSKAPADDLIPIDSVILIENGKAYTHSTAALQILRGLGSPWAWLYAFVIVPKPIRDWAYRLFARYRYRIFGRKDQCMLPTPDVRARFLT